MPDQFAMCFAEEGGILAFGDSVASTTQFFADSVDSFVFAPMTSQHFYAVTLDSLSVGGITVSVPDTNNWRDAVFDSTFAVRSHFGAHVHQNTCSSLLQVSFLPRGVFFALRNALNATACVRRALAPMDMNTPRSHGRRRRTELPSHLRVSKLANTAGGDVHGPECFGTVFAQACAQMTRAFTQELDDLPSTTLAFTGTMVRTLPFFSARP
jgi:hypothetical protein